MPYYFYIQVKIIKMITRYNSLYSDNQTSYICKTTV